MGEPTEGVFQDLGAAIKMPPEWILDELVPVGLGFLGGPPKSKKSTVAMALACTIAGWDCRALPPFMRVTKRTGPSLVFSMEASAGELRHMVEEGLYTETKPDGSILVADSPWDFRLDDPFGMTTLMRWLKDADPRLVIIDPLRDMHAIDENDSGEMNRLLRPLHRWAVKNSASVLILHHTTKPGEGQGTYKAMNLRGTGALYGMADYVLMLTPQGEKLHIEATFKRAEKWERTIVMRSYGQTNSATEVLGDVDKMVLKAHEAGAILPHEVAINTHISVLAAIESLKKLQRNGLI